MSETEKRIKQKGLLTRVQKFSSDTSWGIGTSWVETFRTPLIEKLPGTEIHLNITYGASKGRLVQWGGMYMGVEFSLDGGTSWTSIGYAGFKATMMYVGLARDKSGNFSIRVALPADITNATSFMLRLMNRTYDAFVSFGSPRIFVEEYSPIPVSNITVENAKYPTGILMNTWFDIDDAFSTSNNVRYSDNHVKGNNTDIYVTCTVPAANYRGWSGGVGFQAVLQYSEDNGVTWLTADAAWNNSTFRMQLFATVTMNALLTNLTTNQIKFRTYIDVVTHTWEMGLPTFADNAFNTNFLIRELRKWE